MNAGSLFALALFVPILLAAVFLLPVYLGIFTACYIIYSPAEGAHPLAEKYLDVFYIIDAYSQLLTNWLMNKTTLSFMDYTLPVVGLPLLCAVFSVWLAIKLTKKFLDVFYGFTAAGN